MAYLPLKMIEHPTNDDQEPRQDDHLQWVQQRQEGAGWSTAPGPAEPILLLFNKKLQVPLGILVELSLKVCS